MKALSDLFKALSDETRLQMLALLLRRGELCVCDFVGTMGITQSKASRHLRYLAHAGLVRDRRNAVWVNYRVNEAPNLEASAVLEAIGPVIALQGFSELEARLDAWLAAKTAGAETCRAGRAPALAR